MPPFTTLNGQTGYYMNGQFVPATQQEYDAQFNQPQTQNNPFLQQVFPQNIQPPLMGGRQNFVQQGTIQGPETAGMTNEQKVMQAQGDDTPMLGNMPYGMTEQGLGIQRGKSFFPYNASTASGHPLNTATNTVFNAYDLMASKKGKVVNPFASEVSLMQSQNTQNVLNALNNPIAPTTPSAPTQQINMPEIASTASNAISSAGSNIGSQVSSSVSDVVDKGLKSDVLGDWGNMGFSGKEFFKSDAGKTTSAIASAGVGLVSGLVKAGAPDKYDPRVGMSKPNLGGNLFGDATFTQMGLNPLLMGATGGLSAVVGGGVDLIKNAVKYAKQKDRYDNKKLATDTMQSIDDARENMKPDYTGYARFGTQVNPYIKKFNPGGETPTYSWGTGYVNSPNASKIVSTVSSSNTQTNPSITQTTNIPATNINKKEKKPLPYIDLFTGLNNSKNDKSYYSFDKNIYNDDVFKNVSIDNTYTGINPNMRKVSNAPYKDMSVEGNLNTAARDYLEEIYTSPGYKEKLERELEKSGITDKSVDDIISERLHRVKNTPMQNLSENDFLYNSVYGYMQPQTSGPFITSPSIRMDIDRVKTEPLNYFSTAIEELEHAAHVKQNMFYNMFNDESSQNITPEAKRIFDLHAPATSKQSTQFDDNSNFLQRSLRKPYLKQYTENMAKKRAAEAYLINAGLLKPGENVNEDHYIHLLDNYLFLPSNVKSALDMTNENEDFYQLLMGNDKEFNLQNEKRHDDALKYYKSKENPTKDDLKYYYKNQLKKEELLKIKEKYKKSQENFLKIMNEIAVNNQDNNNVFTARFGTQITNPYLKARSGIYIKPENRGKFTAWAKSHDMGVQEAANTVMSNKEEYNPNVVKMANFAKNAKKWN